MNEPKFMRIPTSQIDPGPNVTTRDRKLELRCMREWLNALERDLEVLERRAESSEPDGFGSGGSGGGGRGGGHSDQVERAAAQRAKYRQPSSEDLALRALGKLDTAARLLQQAHECRRMSMPKPDEQGVRNDADWCAHCLTVTVDEFSIDVVVEPRAVGKDVPKDCVHCRWCHRWQKEHGFLPPAHLVRKHHRSERVTVRERDEAVAAHQAELEAKAAAEAARAERIASGADRSQPTATV